MQNQIATTNSNQITHSGKIFFTTEKDSNYAITTSFNVTYVVEYDQARNIMHSIFNTEADFITVNQTVLNRRYVQSIEPTKEKTEKQKEEDIKKRNKERKREQAKDDLLKLKRSSDVAYLNEKYGVGNWLWFRSGLGLKRNSDRNKHIVSIQDRKDAEKSFKANHPEEYKLMQEIN